MINDMGSEEISPHELHEANYHSDLSEKPETLQQLDVNDNQIPDTEEEIKPIHKDED